MNQETKRSKNLKKVVEMLEGNSKIFSDLKNGCKKDDQDEWYYTKSLEDAQEEMFELRNEILQEKCKVCEREFNEDEDSEECNKCIEEA